MPYRFDAPIWQTPPPGSWHFLTVPEEMADEIDRRTTGVQGGFGSVKVEVTIGGSTWLTSIFPSKQVASYILPLKRSVRSAEGCGAGDMVAVGLVLVGLEPHS
ncbi:DUF1905 domain-containing protein [Miniimonas arenae]|uniref:DUF1905 domain-containing protein n=1 Tax=Miniimonas arenae TaxID=676201 RepID=A0A5C5BC00_9MICO|nr:DUF1905 domain-containing protein [Miniimonas arenae]TNU74103.1 DUF1905 domain-containing protein [Miniimonas arenae]